MPNLLKIPTFPEMFTAAVMARSVGDDVFSSPLPMAAAWPADQAKGFLLPLAKLRAPP
jgi:hypothetical protein